PRRVVRPRRAPPGLRRRRRIDHRLGRADRRAGRQAAAGPPGGGVRGGIRTGGGAGPRGGRGGRAPLGGGARGPGSPAVWGRADGVRARGSSADGTGLAWASDAWTVKVGDGPPRYDRAERDR